MIFTKAIVRLPGENFAQGVTSGRFGLPDIRRARQQHANYCAALEQCGLTLTKLPADAQHPDSTFVEDNAVVTARLAVITRSAAASRVGETENMKVVLRRFFTQLEEISEPGTIDGGDVCMADNHFFIGLSQRTNEAGASQLQAILSDGGFTSSVIDVRNVNNLLHLKSGMAYLGDRKVVLSEVLVDLPEFGDYDKIILGADDEYATNCIRVNDYVIIASGYPALQNKLATL